MREGALDVWTTPVLMKKGRPGDGVERAGCRRPERKRVADAMLRETTTLGVRVYGVHRHEAEREFADGGRRSMAIVTVKLKWVHGALLGVKPEYEDCARLAQAHGVPVRAGRGACAGGGEPGISTPVRIV